MKKKLFAAIAAGAMTLAMVFTAVSCASPKNVKVLTEIELTSEEYAVGVNKSDTDLRNSINTLFASMKEDESMNTLIASYFDGTSTFSYTNTTQENDENNLILATNAAFPPFESVDGNKFVGIDIELGYKIAQSLNKTLYVKDMEFDSIVGAVQNRQSDIALAGMTVSEKRREQIDFSDSYYASAQVITVREDDTLFADCKTAKDVKEVLSKQKKSFKVGTQAGTTGYMYSAGDEDFGYDGFKDLTTKSYTTGALAMQDLRNGKINAVILDKQPSIMIAAGINQ